MIEAKPHPSKYSKALVPTMVEWLEGRSPILDPMAGVGAANIEGLVHVELEAEWVSACPGPRVVGDALALPFASATFGAAVCSPVFGNRMSDHHDAKDGSKRHTYRHYLDRPLHPSNTGTLPWGDRYRVAHQRIWTELRRVLAPGALFVLNASDHVRKGVVEPVATWHVGILTLLGFVRREHRWIETPRQRHGANGELRVSHELLVLFERP